MSFGDDDIAQIKAYLPSSLPLTGSIANLLRMQSWGFNHVRLGLMWAGAEPERGQLNHTYLEAPPHTLHSTPCTWISLDIAKE